METTMNSSENSGSVDAYRSKIEYFDELAPRWDREVGNDSGRMELLARVFDMMEIEPGSTVMDLGCGCGVLFPLINERIGENGRIIAVDSSPGMIRTAKSQNSAISNIEYHQAIIEELLLGDDVLDAAIAFAVFPHVEDKEGALKCLRRLLRPDGVLYIFHLSDTRSLNDFHGALDAPVNGDMLPDRRGMEGLLTGSGFDMSTYIDRAGLNFIEARPC